MVRSGFKRNWSIEDTGSIRKKVILYLILFVVLIVIGVRTRNPVDLVRELSDLSNQTWISLGYWAAVLIFGFAVIRFVIQLRLAEELDENGVILPANIEDKQVIHTSFYMNFVISYQYLQDQRAKAKVPSDIFYQARSGDQIEVLYLKKRPSASRIILDSIPAHADERLEGLKPTPFREHRTSQD